MRVSGTLLPLLFHDNHPALPGFMIEDKPAEDFLFFHTSVNIARIYVLDENVFIFQQNISFNDSHALIHHIKLFFMSTINPFNYLIQGAQSGLNELVIEYYKVEIRKQKKITIRKLDHDSKSFLRPFFNIKVIWNQEEDDHKSLLIYCGDQEFSSLEYGNDIFSSVADYVMEQRASGLPYSVYITDLDLSHGLMGEAGPDHLQTVHYLNYKKAD